MHVKKGDTVKVITGKDKGKSGVVLRALPKENKVIVEGVAVYKRHLKGRSADQVGRIIEKSRPIHVSNVKSVATPAKKVASALDAPVKKSAKKK